ncbi:hypothetical protein LXL04_033500 [Taraxacum kok-saghyz]
MYLLAPNGAEHSKLRSLAHFRLLASVLKPGSTWPVQPVEPGPGDKSGSTYTGLLPIIDSDQPGRTNSILERLPIQDAVRTSILSKKWRYTWTAMGALVFDGHFSNKYSKNEAFDLNGFIRSINRVMILHKGSILKFRLHIPNMFLDSFQEIDQFMLLLSRNELRKLELKKCFLNPPLEFKGFPNLEQLLLYDIGFGATMCGTEISLPQLTRLLLKTCTNVYNFNIKATKLETLVVANCPDTMLLRLSDTPFLTVALICFQKPIKDFVRIEKMNLWRILSNLSRVREFRMDNHFLKVYILGLMPKKHYTLVKNVNNLTFISQFLFAEKIQKLLPHTIYSLKNLVLFHFQLSNVDQLFDTLCLLRSSPNLEMLQMYMKVVSPVDERPASNHLEPPNCLDYTLNQLQTVEIIHLNGSRPELLFIKLLLAHSPSLDKFTMRPNRASYVQKRLDIAKDVLQFPRASTNAKIFCLDPKT